MVGSFNEEAQTLLEMLRRADKEFLASLTKKEREPDSDIAYEIERRGGAHASMGRGKSTREQFQKVRFGREWPQESWYQHKGIPKWHPQEKVTHGVQNPEKGREKSFFPDLKP